MPPSTWAERLAAALSPGVPPAQQAAGLRELLESAAAELATVLAVYPTLLALATAGTPQIKGFVASVVELVLCRTTPQPSSHESLCAQSTPLLVSLLRDSSPVTVKTAIQCLASVYPTVFRLACTDTNNLAPWAQLCDAKTQIIAMGERTGTGVRVAAQKFLQRVIQVQSAGASDPRLKSVDINVNLVAPSHPFIDRSELEAEATKLVEQILTTVFRSTNPDVVAAALNALSPLCKVRPALAAVIVPMLCAWTPDAIRELPATQVRSVEKTMRIILGNLLRNGQGPAFSTDINRALGAQAARMEEAAVAARMRSDERKRNGGQQGGEAPMKRQRIDSPASFNPSAIASTSTLPPLPQPTLPVVYSAFRLTPYEINPVTAFDAMLLPLPAVVQCVMTTLRSLDVAMLNAAIERVRHNLASAGADEVGVKQEALDPLKLELDEEELDFEPEEMNRNLQLENQEEDPADAPVVAIDVETAADGPNLALRLEAFQLPPPTPLSDSDRDFLLRMSITRICAASQILNGAVGQITASGGGSGESAPAMWMMLLARLVTRGKGPEEPAVKVKMKSEESELDVVVYQDKTHLRQMLFDFITEDFPNRVKFATLWLNEEWFSDASARRAGRPSPHYQIWTDRLISALSEISTGQDKVFARFIHNLPEIHSSVLELLKGLCLDSERLRIGFATLRELVALRPPLRAGSLAILLELTTHSDKITRGAAIITVKRWVPDVKPMDALVRAHALESMRRLADPAPSPPPVIAEELKEEVKAVEVGEEENKMEGIEDEDGALVVREAVTPVDPEAEVLRQVELLFALCSKVPDVLDDIFSLYALFTPDVQTHVESLLSGLIRTLGPTNPKLLSLLKTFPPGTENLALSILSILTAGGRPPAPLVALVKTLAAERELDPRFIIPIMAELDKAEIHKHLPRIVSLLNGSVTNRTLIRSVFSSILSSGPVSTNLPRVRQSELLAPAELLCLLHEFEREIGLKSTIEAIGICFSMTDVFRSEVLAVVMQQIVDETVLPVLFLRTVIQSVSTYKSLIGFVSTTLLSRLITKKIWTNPTLWDGFSRLAKHIAPASFGALLQLPKEQLAEMVEKNKGLRHGLREYVGIRGGSRARVEAFLEIIGEDEDDSAAGVEREQSASTAVVAAEVPVV